MIVCLCCFEPVLRQHIAGNMLGSKAAYLMVAGKQKGRVERVSDLEYSLQGSPQDPTSSHCQPPKGCASSSPAD